MSVAQSPKLSAPGSDAKLQDWLQYLESLHPKAIEMGLDRIQSVAAKLPIQSSAVKFVVAGTNGKGSTCAMLEAILLASGWRVGMYTSPHLINFNERARINGETVSDIDLIQAFETVQANRGNVSLTYFEFTTLAIFLLFAKQSLDVWVLEVGLGGRLDAVNIVDADCAIVTSVDLDHQDWLGDTRESIGWEKAHVFRAGRPAICADPQPPQTLLDYASEIGADLWLFGRDFNYAGDRQQWGFAGRSARRNALAYPALRGANQLLNASGALAALESLRDRIPVTQQAVRQGLIQAALPGRFQILPGQPVVILDVAHNPHAAAVLEKNLGNMGFHPYTYAVFGMMADKDIDSVIGHLARRIDRWYCVSLPGQRAMPGNQLAEKVREVCSKHRTAEDGPVDIEVSGTVAQAYDAVCQKATPDDRIVVFGSFLTVAGVLDHLGRR
ncbi:MAG: bifunctional tetrahydrofolate synthase/dihydrofolate synthase [Burkholderiaceae bacterium]|nr:bifunctional tetrahydrofolate synthase/dihydrofolate synthase [Burkholderiaceae bacterium]MCD8518030.1 bifunctional tetrahydrofolate synthase/dihydrofolate synthase [Burkholderiaceae bacterium]MCD8564353.1 bifunctional tetrahydrofolate synthase/dihydrofolate synthase [Burkholderiaceae bacterium]